MKKAVKKKTVKKKAVARKSPTRAARAASPARKEPAKKLSFKDAFKYPFNRPKGLLNILWILLPIFGWLALMGYMIRIVKEFIQGKYKEVPKLSFGSDMSLGFMMLVKSLPLLISFYAIVFLLLLINPFLSSLFELVVGLFIFPVVFMNFFMKQTVASTFEFGLVKHVFSNFGEYIEAILKSIGLGLIFVVMILVLVGFPAICYTQYIFWADFFRRYVK